MLKRFALLLALSLSSSTFAVSNSLPANSQVFRFVRLLQMFDDQGKSFFCSGVLLQSGMVLTAAHCVIHNGKAFSKIIVKLNHSDPGVAALNAGVVPGWKDNVDDPDLAMLYTPLENEGHALLPVEYAFQKYKASLKNTSYSTYSAFMNATNDETIAKVFAQTIEKDSQGSESAYSIGFGLTCPNLADCNFLTNGANYIHVPLFQGGKTPRGTVCSNEPAHFSTQGSPTFCMRADRGRGKTEQGDSGGPTFVFDAEGEAVVVGITSYGSREASFITNLVGYTGFLKTSLTSPNNERVRWIDFEAHTDRPAITLEQRNVKVSIEQRIRQQAETMAKLLGAPAGEVESETLRLYEPQVNFYDKPYTAARIASERLAAAKKWPTRTYTVREGNTAFCNDYEKDLCRGTFDLDYVISNGSGTRRGTSRYIWTFKKNDNFRIVEEVGAVK